MVTEVTSPPTVWLCIRVVSLVTSTLTAVLGLNPSSQLRETLVSEVESMTSPSTISGRPTICVYSLYHCHWQLTLCRELY